MSSQLFYSNFDFEYQLRGKYQPTSKLKRLNEELAFCWLAIAEPGDQILLEHAVEPAFVEYLRESGLDCPEFITDVSDINATQLTPWGWSEPPRKFARSHKLCANSPPLECVRRVNHRRWALELEEAVCGDRKLTARFRTLSELKSLLRDFDDGLGWIIKLPYSMSGRDQLRGTGIELTDAETGWVRNRIPTGDFLILERRLDLLGEFGVQFDVPSAQDASSLLSIEGEVVPMIADQNGRYAGSWLLESSPRDRSELDRLQEVIGNLQSEGYFGPVGFDVMNYRDGDGEERTRLFQDINARFTMGRLALGWRRYLKPGEVGCWLHLSHRCQTKSELADWWANRSNLIDSHVRLVRTSPFEHAGQVLKHQTGLLIAPSETIAREQVQRLLNCD